MYVLRRTTCRYLANQLRCQERMPRIRLKYAGTSGIFKILKARICRCDVRRFKCTFSLTDADTGKHIDAQQTHTHTHILWYKGTKACKRILCLAFFLHFFILLLLCSSCGNSWLWKSHAIGLMLISIYVSFQKYVRIFLLSRQSES